MNTKLDIYLELLDAIEGNEQSNNPTYAEVEKLANQRVYSEIEMDLLLEEMHKIVVDMVDEDVKNGISKS